MKTPVTLPVFLAGLFALATILYAADEVNKDGPAAEKKCAEIMKDKRLMAVLMDRIADDEPMRMDMMGKLLANAKTRKDRMREMSGVMLGDGLMKEATMDDIVGDDSMRQQMMKKMMKQAKNHQDEIKPGGQMLRADEKHSQYHDENAEGMQMKGKDRPVSLMNAPDPTPDPAGK